VGRDEPQDLAALLQLAPGLERTAGLAAWFQSLYAGMKGVPVLVGGSALELYTGGAYTSGDLDFVGDLTEAVTRQLQQAGFSRQGRHWVHERGEVFLEVPGKALEPHERAVQIQVGRWKVLALSPEDVLVDRLAAWQFWGSLADAFNALLLRRSTAARLDRKRVRRAAAARGVSASLERLERYARRLGDSEPTTEEFERWVKEEGS
jgi:hypothetical protein